MSYQDLSSIAPSALQDVAAWRAHLHQRWSDRSVAVWGAARSGVAAANLLVEIGARVCLSDPKSTLSPEHAEALDPRVSLSLGGPNVLGDAEIVIPSPGLRPDLPLLKECPEGVTVMSEIELGARCTRARLVGVTGTDGKSTTTSLITHFLTALNVDARSVGNIGDPLCSWALEASPQSVLVVEVSAFQLWSTQYFPAEVGLLTNLAEDHFDYFLGSASRYAHAKLKLARLLPPQSTFLWPDLDLPFGGGATRMSPLDDVTFAETLGADKPEIVRFGLDPRSPWSASEGAYRAHAHGLLASMNLSPLLGRHHHRNIISALATIDALGLDPRAALSAISEFRGLSHRMELVRTLRGVRWVDDSKATNINASSAGLKSVDGSMIVIAGGYDKGLNHAPLVELLSRRARHICLIGQTGPILAEALGHSGANFTLCVTLERAVIEAHRLAQPEELVILSPATSSFDQFESFVARGQRFQSLVHQLD
jgi:UDP-N-acetylmuramoylalanine--D-glutamate ligase